MDGRLLIEGGCLCGRVRYYVEGKPIWIGYCHCHSCRKATGGAAVIHVGVNSSDLEFTKGERSVYESSPGVRRGFCANCGTPLTYESDSFDEYVQIYVGTFDEPSNLRPQAHVHSSERVGWFDVNDNLPRIPGSAAERSEDWRGGWR